MYAVFFFFRSFETAVSSFMSSRLGDASFGAGSILGTVASALRKALNSARYESSLVAARHACKHHLSTNMNKFNSNVVHLLL